MRSNALAISSAPSDAAVKAASKKVTFGITTTPQPGGGYQTNGTIEGPAYANDNTSPTATYKPKAKSKRQKRIQPKATPWPNVQIYSAGPTGSCNSMPEAAIYSQHLAQGKAYSEQGKYREALAEFLAAQKAQTSAFINCKRKVENLNIVKGLNGYIDGALCRLAGGARMSNGVCLRQDGSPIYNFRTTISGGKPGAGPVPAPETAVDEEALLSAYLQYREAGVKQLGTAAQGVLDVEAWLTQAIANLEQADQLCAQYHDLINRDIVEQKLGILSCERNANELAVARQALAEIMGVEKTMGMNNGNPEPKKVKRFSLKWFGKKARSVVKGGRILIFDPPKNMVNALREGDVAKAIPYALQTYATARMLDSGEARKFMRGTLNINRGRHRRWDVEHLSGGGAQVVQDISSGEPAAPTPNQAGTTPLNPGQTTTYSGGSVATTSSVEQPNPGIAPDPAPPAPQVVIAEPAPPSPIDAGSAPGTVLTLALMVTSLGGAMRRRGRKQFESKLQRNRRRH